MKIAVFLLAIMVMCICPGRISEEKDLALGEQRRPKDCRFPKGKHGSVLKDGCIQSTCSNGKWKPKMRTDICCYKQQVHKPNTVLDKIVSADNCSSTTIGCGAVAQLEFIHESCTDPATKQQVEKLEQQIEEGEEKLDHLTQMVKDNFELVLSDEKCEKCEKCDTNTPIPISGPGCECTTTTSAAPPTTNPMMEGVLISGGRSRSMSGGGTYTELFMPHSGKTCTLPSLPDGRYHHSLDVVSNKIILCGGYYTTTSCLQFHPTSSTGSWDYYATLAQGRSGHNTLSFQGDLLLMGGRNSRRTTEIIGNGTQYNLQQDTYNACSIPDKSSTILTGGYDEYSSNYKRKYLKTVVKYNMQGFVENLPDLAQGRSSHGCGYYKDNGNNKVMVVAGGKGLTDAYLSSTELLTSGAKYWTTGEPLPRTIAYFTNNNMGSYILSIGGVSDGKIFKNILKFNGTWTEVGMMKIAIFGAAATKINMNIDNHLDITDCN